MKTFIVALGLSLLSLSALAAPACPSCRPRYPAEFQCQIEMVDCTDQALYIYTGTAESHQAACHEATRVCMNDLRLGYGGYGAKCWMIGKKEN
jgi:hypothetical protein